MEGEEWDCSKVEFPGSEQCAAIPSSPAPSRIFKLTHVHTPGPHTNSEGTAYSEHSRGGGRTGRLRCRVWHAMKPFAVSQGACSIPGFDNPKAGKCDPRPCHPSPLAGIVSRGITGWTSQSCPGPVYLCLKPTPPIMLTLTHTDMDTPARHTSCAGYRAHLHTAPPRGARCTASRHREAALPMAHEARLP